MTSLWLDLHYAPRMMAKRPQMTAVLVLAAAVALSVALGASLRGLFYGEPLAQPALLAAVAVAVASTALLATWIPVRRATEIQLTVALRAE